MANSFKPPGIRSLVEIDRADCKYGSRSIMIEGLVSGSSQGGWSGKASTFKVHCYSLAAWRRAGKPIVERELTILRPVPVDADGSYFRDFPAYSTQRIRILLSTDEMRAIVKDVLETGITDDELQAIADKLQQPVVVWHDQFGRMALDRTLDYFNGVGRWDGVAVTVSVPAEQDSPVAQALAAAESLWASQKEWKKQIEQAIASDLVDLWNRTWRSPGEKKLSGRQFLQQISPDSVVFQRDGEFEFYYCDDDQFAGHLISVRGDLQVGLGTASLSG